jgi:hypothetical protein
MSLCLAACASPRPLSTAQSSTAQSVGGSSTLATKASLSGTAGSSPALGASGDLTGLDGPGLERLFGKPGLIRNDDPAQVWQYRNPSCVMDIYLYPDNDRLTVTHAEARAPKIAGDPLAPCIARLSELKQKTTG